MKFLFLFVFLLLVDNALAQEVTASIDPLSTDRLLRTFFSLVAVCALIVLVLGLLGRRLKSTDGQAAIPKIFCRNPSTENKLLVKETIKLSTHVDLVLISVAGKRDVVLSVSRQGVEPIGFLDHADRFVPMNEAGAKAATLFDESLFESVGGLQRKDH